MEYTYPNAGAHYKDGACHFVVWAPLKQRVEVLLNEQQYFPLLQDKRGYWSATLPDVQPGDLYRFRLDGEKTLPDPASRHQPQGVHGPSAIAATHFNWTDDDWKGMSMEALIIYELHTGTFTKEGTFKGIISKLDYLQRLGITAIELMPVAAFPGSRNWGYDGVYPFAVQESYGGITGLKELVNAAHAAGIAVILDVVYNHHGPEGNYFNEYGPYYTEKYKTPWGSAINFDDAWCDAVRHFYWQNALMWLDEFHIDGLRLDAVHAIWDYSARHFVEVLTEKVRQLEQQSGRKKVLIAEFDLNNPRYINPPERGGYGLDGQWMDEFHHALHSVVTGETDGYYEDFGKVSDIAKALRDSYVYTGQYSVHRKKHFGVLPAQDPYNQFVVFAQNHDQVGNRLLGDRITHQVSYECLKLLAATVLLSPHIPLLFMGEEYGETNPFSYFISHTDKELVEIVRKGRREEFSYFNWQGEIPDPASEENFQSCQLSWNHERDKRAATLLHWYQQLVHLRKTHPSLRSYQRDHTIIHYNPATSPVIAMERKSADAQLLVLLNFEKQQACISPPVTVTLRKVMDSAAAEWEGPGAVAAAQIPGRQPIPVHAESALIFECQ